MLGMNINKFLIFVIMITVLIQGVDALDNVTILETYSDGQPKHIYIMHPLSEPRVVLDPAWKCTEYETDPAIVTRPRCLVNPKPSDYITIAVERIEYWLNPYGQAVAVRTPDQGSNEIIRKQMPENLSEVLAAENWANYYIDENGYAVSYFAEQIIPSNRIIKAAPQYPPGYNAALIMQDLNMTKEQFLDVRNYDRINQEAFNHSPAYQEKKIKELEAQLNATKNQTIQQESKLDMIRDWINQTFGISLW